MTEFRIFDRAGSDHRPVVHPLVAFEAIRRILGHAAWVEREALERLLTKRWEAAVLGYAAKLRSRKVALFDELRPDPVLPDVDAVNLKIHHVTCTGGTELEVTPAPWAAVRSRLRSGPCHRPAGHGGHAQRKLGGTRVLGGGQRPTI